MSLSICAEAADPAIGFECKQLSDEFFAEGVSFGDIDGDGSNDLVSSPYWYAGPDFEQRYEIYPPLPFDPEGYSNNFFSFTYDIDGDYQLTVLTLKDGRVLSGMLRGSNDDAVTVAMVGGVQQVVSRADMAKREMLEVSMMPEGPL